MTFEDKDIIVLKNNGENEILKDNNGNIIYLDPKNYYTLGVYKNKE